MFAVERQKIICDFLAKKGSVQIGELVQKFNVSDETIRRDLLRLEKLGKLQRTHGGAVLNSYFAPNKELKERIDENKELKYKLSQKCAEFISESDIIAIESGSTAIEFCEVLKTKFNHLTVLTNSIDVMELLGYYKDFNVILCGGHLLREEKAFYGKFATDMIERFHVSKAFIFPASISLHHGIMGYSFELYDIAKSFEKIADNIFIMADSSKFEKNALYKIKEIESTDTIITDSSLSDDIYNMYIENNVNLIR